MIMFYVAGVITDPCPTSNGGLGKSSLKTKNCCDPSSALENQLTTSSSPYGVTKKLIWHMPQPNQTQHSRFRVINRQ